MRIKSLSRIVRRVAKELGIGSTTGERRLLCTELEDRTLLSAAPMDPAMAAPAPADNPDAAAAAPDASAGNTATLAPDSSTGDSASAPYPVSSSGGTSNGTATGGSTTATDVAKKEVVFLDSSAENYQELLTTLLDKASADSSLKVVLLDDSMDGIQKVSETLSEYHDLATVHILTSGTDGGVKLGNQMLTVDSLAGRAGEVALWHNALQPSGDLMFYGCDLGATDAGAELLAGIAALTGDGVGAGETMIKASTEAPADLVDVVLIDKNLDDVETLTKAVLAGDQIFLYDGTDESAADVLADVVSWANATHSRISTFSILSHGAAGGFEVGNQWVTTSFLEQTAAGWQQLSMVLAEQATINLYSCDVVAAGSDGQMLIDRLAQLTGAAVYASVNTTGNGGDWVLEAASFGAQQSLTNLTPTLDMQLLESSAATLAWYNAGWQYRQTLTIDNAMVSGTNDLTNFAVLVSITDADLKSTGNGGMVGQTDGGDILFTSADGTTKLDHEIESYDATTGTLRAWVRIPTLSYSADTQLYIYYGNAAAADQWNSSGTWGSNVKAVYHLDSNYSDSTSNANNGTNSGTTNLTSAQIAGGDTFNGSSQNINVADSNSLDITGNFTLSAWFSKTSNSGWDVIVSKGSTTAQINYYLATNGTELVVGFTDSGGTWTELATSGLGLTTGTWYHAAATYDDAANTWKLYLDGNQVASASTTVSAVANTGTLTIGKSPWGEWFAGSLDEVKVESTTRSADWIKTQFNNQDSPATYVKLAAAPVNTVPAAQQASGITPLTFSTANGNAIFVSDADGGASIEKVTLSVNNGTLSLGSTAGLTFLIGDGTSDASMSFTGTLADINTALQGLNYTVTPFFSGTDTLTIVTDDRDPADAHTDTDTVTINVAAPGTPYVITGSYTGDGTDNRNITGIGFQPDVVLIKARTNQIGVIRTSSMSGDLSKDMTGATALQANHIQSLLADGFQLGTDATVNSSGVVYDYIVFKASTGFLTVGSYSGNGVDNRAITGLGMSPDALFVMSASGSEAVFSTTADEGNTYNFNNGTAGTNHIQSLDGDGFTLGTDTRVNGSGVTYHYIAWNEMAGAMDVGSYSGNGVDNRNITGVGFQAEWMMVQSDGNDTVAHFDSQGATTDTSSFLDGTASTTNRIQQLQSDGFQVGTDADVNSSGTFYQYLAFKQQTATTITSISNQTILEDGTTGAIAFTIGDAETSASNLSVRVTSSNSTLVPSGNLVLGGSGANRTLTITPAANQNGTATITVDVTDGGTITTRTFTLTVTAVNDVPVRSAGNPSAISVNEDSANSTAVTLGTSTLTYGVGGGADEVSQTLTYKLTGIPSFVTVWLADGTTQVTANTTLSLAQLQGLKYKTVADAIGSGNLTWTVQDNGGTANGGVDLLTETLAIMVTAVNDVPVRTAGSPAAISVNEDSANTTAVTLGMNALTYGVGGGSDETAQTLTYKVTVIPSFMTVWLADGTTPVAANTTVSLAQLQGLKYKTVANANGSGTLTWTVQDNGGTTNGGVDTLTETLSITVGSVNDVPVRSAGNPSTTSVNEDSANSTAVSLGMSGLTYGVGGGSDEAAQTLTYKVTVIPSCMTLWLADGTTQVMANTALSLAQLQGLKYKTVADAVGSGNLTWTVQDNGGTSNGGVDLLTETLSVTVNAVNDVPVRTAGNPAAISVNEDSANSTAVTLGMSALTYGVGGGSDEAGQTLTYKVTVIPSAITVWLADGTTQVTTNTTLSLAQLQGLKYKTVADAVGSGNLTWTVQDNGGTSNGGVDLLTETLGITIGAVNDQPVRTAGNPSAISVNEDSANSTTVTLGMNGLIYGVGGGSDESGQTLTYKVTVIPSCMTLWLADGTTQVTANTTLSLAQLQGLRYKTVADAVGSGNLTWTVQDNGGTSNGGVDLFTETLSITVGAVNDQPVRTAGNPAAISVNEDSANSTAVTLGMSSLTYGVGGGADEAGQTLTYKVTVIPSCMTLWLADGTTQVTANTTVSLAQLQGLKYKTIADVVGSGNLTWTVQDNGGTSNGGVDLLTETLGITVGAVNDAPVRTAGNPAAISVNEDSANSTAVTLGMSALTYGVGGGSDEAAQTLTYKVTVIPSAITVWLADGTTQVAANTTLSLAQLQGLKYKTVADAVGSGNLTWMVQDNGGTPNGGVDTLAETLSITVYAVNDSPVRSAGTPSAISVNEDSANTTAVTLGMSGLTYGVGGGSDEASQTLTYKITSIPSAVTLWLADGTTQVSANTTLSLAQLQGLKYKTVADAVGTGSLTWTIQDDGGTSNGGVDLLPESLTITVGAVNDAPVRTAGNPSAISVDEDSSNITATSLGMSGLSYAVGGGADETSQTLTYTVTVIPSCVTLWLADGTTQVSANTTLSLAQLQGLKYKTVADVVGSGNLTWTVQDDGGTANGGVDLLIESLSITIGAVNDQPARTAGNPAAINVEEDSSNVTTTSLGLSDLAYGVGGGSDEAGQTLTYTVTAIPSCMTLWLTDGSTQVAANTTLSLAQLQGLKYKTVADAVGTGNLTWTVQDDGGTANGGVDLLTETLSITVGAVNDAPDRSAGNPAAISVNEDSASSTAVTLGMSGLTYAVGGGSDEASQTLTYKVTSIPSCVTVWLADGATQVSVNTTLSLAQLQGLEYKTVADAVGGGNLTWTVQDSGGTSNGGVDLLMETLSITVGAVNDVPVRSAASPVAINVNEDSANSTAISLGMSSLTYGVGGGSDEASQTLNYKVTAIPSCVTIWLADGTTQVSANTTLSLTQLQGLKYMTVADAVGTGNLTWTIQDNGGTSNGGVDLLTETLAITVGVVNDMPVRTAGNLSPISVDEDSSNVTAVSVGMSGLTYGVGGGSDEATQTLTYQVTTIPSCITLWLADGTTQVTANTTLSLAQLQGLKYKTVADAVGSGNLTWTVQDNGGTANSGVDLLTETLGITVGAVNDTPVRTAGTVSDLNVAEDSGTTSLGLGGLTYGVGGGADESSQTLNYTVTAVPSSVLGNIVLADGTTIVTANTAYSLAQLKGMQFKTAADANGGPATFSWTVRDSGGTANGGADLLTESLTITVTAVNDAPVNTVPGAQSISEDTSLVFSSGNGNSISIGDVDSGSSSVSVTLSVGHGIITLAGTTGLTFVSGTNGAGLMTFTGTVSNINAALAGMSYTPTANYNGSDTLTILTDDQGNAGSGGPLADSDTIAITVGAVNDAPVTTMPGAQATLEETPLVFSSAGGNLLSIGDIDAGSGSLSVTLSVAHGTLTLAGTSGLTFTSGANGAAAMTFTGNVTDVNAALAGMAYSPTSNFNGSDTLTITTDDQGNNGTGGPLSDTDTVMITVGAVNDAPIRTAGTINDLSVAEDSGTTSLGLGSLAYGPGGGSLESSQSLTYTVTAVPAASLGNIVLADGSTIVNANTTYTLTQLQGMQFKTAANAVGGPTTFAWTIQDDGGTTNGGIDSLTESLSITVGAVNDAPVRTAGNPAAISVNEDSANTTAVALGMSGLTYGVGGGSDEAVQTLTYKVTSIPSAVTLWLADGTTQVSANTTLSLAQLQGLKYKTVADAVGAGNLTWTVQDNGGTANGGVDLLTETLAITVGAVNDVPIRTAGNPATISVDEDSANTTAVTLGMSGLTYGVGGGSDEALQTLTYHVTAIPSAITLWLTDGTTQVSANTTLSLAQLQGLKYKTVADAVGTGNLTWTVQDNGGTSNGGVDLLTETLSVNVGAVNDAPVRTAGNPAAFDVNEDSANTTAVTLGLGGLTYGVGGGSDEASQTLTYQVTAIPSAVTLWLADGTTQVSANATLTLSQLQGLKYKTVADAVGTGNLTWTVQDNGGTANGGVDLLTESLAINVGAVNDAPVRTAGAVNNLTVSEDAAATSLGLGGLTYGVGGGADESSQTLTFTVTAVPSSVLGNIVLADGTTVVTANTAYTLTQLRGMHFKPAADANGGPATFSWTVQDSGGTAIGGADLLAESLTITVTAVNDAPVNSLPGAQTIAEDTSLAFSSGNGNLIAIGDVEAGSSSVSVTLSVAHGTLTLSGTSGLAFTSGTNGAAAMTFTGSVTNINAALAGMSYAPTANYNGSDTLTILTDDQGNTGSGGALSDSDTIAITVGAVNDAPINSVTGAQATIEDTSLVFSSGNGNLISVGDVDAGSGSLSVTLSVAHGTLTLSGTSALTFTSGANGAAAMTFTGNISDINAALDGMAYAPATSYYGADTLTLTTDDQGNTGSGGALSDTDTVAISIGAVNHAPVRAVGTVNDLLVAEDSGTTSLGLSGLVYGPGGGSLESSQTLTYTVTAVPSSALGDIVLADGTTVVTANTTYSLKQLQGMQFKTAANANGGPMIFAWTVQDNGGTANGGVDLLPESLSITVGSVNDAPIRTSGNPAAISVNEDSANTTATTLDMGGLTYSVGGGSDEASQTLTYKVTTIPSTVTLWLADGATQVSANTTLSLGQLQGLKYKTVADAVGIGNLTWTMQDNGGTSNGGVDLLTETLSITVGTVNDAPVRTAGTVSDLNVVEDSGTTSLGLGGLTYGPGGGSDEASQSLTYKVDAVPSSALGDIVLADGATIVTANTTYTLAQLRGMQFKTAANANGGPATFSWTVQDSGGTANGGVDLLTESLAITVDAVNDAPVNSVPVSQSTLQDISLVFSTTDGNALSIVDIDAGSNSLSVTLGVGHGTLTLGSTIGLTFTSGADGTATMTFTGTAAAINVALDGLTYAPTTHFNGTDHLSITTDDQGNSGSGGPMSDTDSIVIAVGAVNHTPVRTAGTVGNLFAFEDSGTTSLGLGSLTYDPGIGESSQTLTYTVTAVPSSALGDIVLSDGTTVVTTNTSYSLTQLQGMQFKTAANAVGGPATFAWTIQDDGGTTNGGIDSLTESLSITVGAVNDAPVRTAGNPSPISANEDSANTTAVTLGLGGLTYGVGGGSDEASQTLTYKVTAIPSYVTMWLADGTTQVAANTTLSLAQLQGLKYKTVADAVGTGNLTWTVQDDGGTANGGVDLLTETLSITVGAVNDAPIRTVGTPSPINVVEDSANTTAVTLGLSGLAYGVGGGSDEAVQTLTYQVTSIPSAVTLWLADGTTQVAANTTLSLAQLQGLKYKTIADAVGSGNLTWTVQDNDGTTNGGVDLLTETLSITVDAVNDAPIRTAGNLAPISVNEDSTNSTAVTLGLSGLTYGVGGGSDEASQTLTYKVTAIPSAITLWLADGTTQVTANTTVSLTQLQGLKYKTVADAIGSGSLTWTVQDNGGTANGGVDLLTESLAINVGAVNDAPVRSSGNPSPINVDEDSANSTAVTLGLGGLTYGVGGGSDEASQTLTYKITTIPSMVTLWLADGTTQVSTNSTLSLAQLQGLGYKTVADAVGSGNLTWTVQDNGGTTNGGVDLLTETLAITIGTVNDVPIRTAGTPSPISIDEDSANSMSVTLGLSGLTYGVGGGSDEVSQTLTYKVTSMPSIITLWLADGTTQVSANTTLTLSQLQGLKYKTVANAVGSGNLTWTVQDDGGTANGGVDLLTESLAITVGAVNDAPVRSAGSSSPISVDEDSANSTALSLGLGGLTYGVGGGSDEAAQTLTYEVTAIPPAITLWLADGSTQVSAGTTLSLGQLQGLKYKTVADAVGAGSLTWTVQDNGGTSNGGVDTLTESLSITVGAVNDAPVRTAGNPAPISVGEDSANTTAVTLGMTGLTYGVGGGSDEASQTLTYQVTAIPSAITLWLADGTTQVPANTTVSLAQLQGLKYKTVADAVGSGSLTWTVQDNGGTANGGVDTLTETLSVTIGAVNDVPVRTAANPATISVVEDNANTAAVTLGMNGLTYGVGGGSDEVSQSLTYKVTAIPSVVTLWLADGTTQVMANTTLSLAQLQGLQYKTVANAVGSGNLTWTVQDDGGTSNGGVDLLTETLTLTVGAVNDVPVLSAGNPAAISVDEDSANSTAVSLGMNGLTYGVGGGTDEASQALTYQVTTIPSAITLWLADGLTQVTANTTLSLAQLQGLKYKTVADAVGSGNLTWTVQDDGGTSNGGVDLLIETLAINVGAVNDAPVRSAGNPAAISVNEDSANTTAVTLGMSGLTYGVGGGSDETSQTLTYKVTTIPSCVTLWLADGTTQVTVNTTLSLAQLQGLKYKTVADAIGSGNLTWTVQDSGGTTNGGVDLLTETLAINVGAVNDVPVRTAGSPTPIGVNEDSANSTAISLGLSGLTYGVGGSSDEASQTLTYQVTTIPSTITLWLADGTTQVTANTTLSLAQLQGLKYKTVADAVGTGNLAWTVQDDGGTANGGVDLLTESLAITVGAVNDAPVRTAGSPVAISVDEDSANTTAVSLGLSGLNYGVGGGSDEASQALTYKVTAIPSAVTLWLADGTTQVTANTTLSLSQLQGLQYKTVADAVGTGNLAWTVQDDGGTSNGGVDTLTETMLITVNAVNDVPIRVAGSTLPLSVDEDSASVTAVSLGLSGLNYTVGGGSDEASQTLVYKVTAIPSAITLWLVDGTTQVTTNTTLSLAQLQGLKYKTVADTVGAGNLTWTVQDDGGTANGGTDLLTESLAITVGAVNDAPVRTTGSLAAISVDEDGANTTAVMLGMGGLTYGVGGESDEASQTLTYEVTAIPSAITLYLADGTTQVSAGTTLSLAQLQGLKYKAIPNANGSGSLTWTVQDNGGTANGGVDLLTESLSITVATVNDAPIRIAGTVANVAVAGDSGTTSLGLGGLTYGVGGGGDESSQTLTYTVTAVPSSALGNIVLADGTTVVTANTAYSLAQLQSMQFKPAANGNGGSAAFAWIVQDDGGTSRGGADALTESLAITVTPVSHIPASVAVPGAQISTSIGLTFSSASHNAITVAGAADQGPLVVTIQATDGIVTLGSWSGITFLQGYGVGDQLLTISGTVDQLNTALNGLYFRASAMYGGISIQVTDANGSTALADVAITQAPLVDYGASIASTDVNTFTTTQGVQATLAVGAVTAASAASEMAAGTANPGLILSASTSDVSPIPTTAAGTVFSNTATYVETVATLTSENEAPASYRLKGGRPDNAFRNEPPTMVQSGEDLQFELEVRSSEQSQTPAKKVDDETLGEIERDPGETASEQTTAEVVESAILALTSGFLTYSLAFDQVLRNRVQDILEASSRNSDQPF